MLFPALKITFRAERRYEMAYVTVPKDLTKIKSKVMSVSYTHLTLPTKLEV